MKSDEIRITTAEPGDAEEIYALQKIAYVSEAEIYNDFNIPPLAEPLEETLNAFKAYTILKAVLNGKIIGSVRGELTDDYIYIGRLMVLPPYQGRGLGKRLMHAIEAAFPHIQRFILGTGHLSERNLGLYRGLGYKEVSREPMNDFFMVRLEKRTG
jgi:ribosomal protein S18 acetylase RimI-like enzyme